MINENLSKIGELGIWLIQWFGDFSKDIKVLQIRTLNSIIRFLVAPLKILILFELGFFVFSDITRKIFHLPTYHYFPTFYVNPNLPCSNQLKFMLNQRIPQGFTLSP